MGGKRLADVHRDKPFKRRPPEGVWGADVFAAEGYVRIYPLAGRRQEGGEMTVLAWLLQGIILCVYGVCIAILWEGRK